METNLKVGANKHVMQLENCSKKIVPVHLLILKGTACILDSFFRENSKKKVRKQILFHIEISLSLHTHGLSKKKTQN